MFASATTLETEPRCPVGSSTVTSGFEEQGTATEPRTAGGKGRPLRSDECSGPVGPPGFWFVCVANRAGWPPYSAPVPERGFSFHIFEGRKLWTSRPTCSRAVLPIGPQESFGLANWAHVPPSVPPRFDKTEARVLVSLCVERLPPRLRGGPLCPVNESRKTFLNFLGQE